MAEDKPLIQIDSDWKKQAQEEKKRLAEQQAKPAASPTATTSTASTGASRGRRADREAPVASFPAIVQTLMTQAMYYLGELSPEGQDTPPNLDMAKYQIDLMSILEDKTAGKLAPDEQKMLDAALYETRSRFVAVAQQYI